MFFICHCSSTEISSQFSRVFWAKFHHVDVHKAEFRDFCSACESTIVHNESQAIKIMIFIRPCAGIFREYASSQLTCFELFKDVPECREFELVDRGKIGPKSQKFLGLLNCSFSQACMNPRKDFQKSLTFQLVWLPSRICNSTKSHRETISQCTESTSKSKRERVKNAHGVVEHWIIPWLEAGLQHYISHVLKYFIQSVCCSSLMFTVWEKYKSAVQSG